MENNVKDWRNLISSPAFKIDLILKVAVISLLFAKSGRFCQKFFLMENLNATFAM